MDRQTVDLERVLPDPDVAIGFADKLLDWHHRHGRKNLPWQIDPTPYRIWLSEIMLQQTQVATVIPYYHRFLERFPTLTRLAGADIDEVLHLWSGLGYYARARNLHRAATIIRDRHGGRFPTRIDDLVALPGVGRSTAGAILAFSQHQRHPILDGNVKRVLTRHFMVEGDPGNAAVGRALWALADHLTPYRGVDRYTQAIMDLGASVCGRRSPDCTACPLADRCLAHRHGNPLDFPRRKAKKKRPQRSTGMLVLENESGCFLLEKRGPSGIWGGLWSLPEVPRGRKRLRCPLPGARMRPRPGSDPPPVRHGFTHFELVIQPCRYRLVDPGSGVMDDNTHIWYNPAEPQPVGLPAAIKRLLDSFQT